MVKILLLAAGAAAAAAPAGAAWVFEGQWPDPVNNNTLSNPNGLIAYSDTVFYVTDTDHHRVWRVDVNGPQQYFWGSYGSEPGQFNYPYGLGLSPAPDNKVYVVDSYNQRVQIFDFRGSFLYLWYTPDGKLPSRIAVASNKYAALPFSNYIWYYTDAGSLIYTWGGYGTGPGQFNGLAGVAFAPNGNVYAVDMFNNRIQYFTVTGSYLGGWGEYGSGPGQFKIPLGITVSNTGYVFVTDAGNYRVQQFTLTGSFVDQWGSTGTGYGEFKICDAISVSPSGRVVFVADRGYSRVQWFREEFTAVTPASLGRVKALFQ